MGTARTLLLGLGNPSRSDDGAGWEVVSLFDFLRLPGVETRVSQQLGLELLEEWDGFDRVVFVDAAVDEAEVHLERVEESPVGFSSSTHHLRPETLLRVAEALHVQCPELYLCRIPATNFEFGEPFSPDTRRHILKAVRVLRDWLAGDRLLNREAQYART